MATFVCSSCDQEGREGVCIACGKDMLPIQSLADLKMSDTGGNNCFVCIGDPDIVKKLRQCASRKK